MLKIVVPAWEEYDSSTNQFLSGKETTLSLEHSLISLSKWESKYHKPFLNNKDMTSDEMLDYIRFMTLTPNVNKSVFSHLTDENHRLVAEYIKDPMTATTFSGQQNAPRKREIITSEIIYYWMVSLNIPFECQKWHLNRLLTLIRVVSIKSQPNKKMSKKDAAARARSLNAARRAKYSSKG